MKLREDYINPEGGMDTDAAPGISLSTTSLDAQVNAYLQSFEENAVNLSEAFMDSIENQHLLSEGFKLLFEQEEEGGEEDLDAIVSDIESDVESLEVGTVQPKIDLQSFATSTQALLETIQNKLDFANPVINMAVLYIREQYDDELADQLIETFKEMGYKIKIEGVVDVEEAMAATAEEEE